jgi:hypothetical protein
MADIMFALLFGARYLCCKLQSAKQAEPPFSR